MNFKEHIVSKLSKKSKVAPEEVSDKTLSQKQLREFNWDNFGKRLLQAKALSASFESKPSSVDVYTGLDGLPRVELQFTSTITKETTTIVIDKSEVLLASKDVGYVESKEMSKIWQEVSGLKQENVIGPVM